MRSCRKRSLPCRLTIGVAGALVLTCASAFAQTGFLQPLTMGILTPARDDAGAVLQGNAEASPVQCDAIQILWATNGIFPPNGFGEPNAQNPVCLETRIGELTAYGLSQPGIFAAVEPQRLPDGSKLFVRAFDAPTVEASTHYTDSEIETVASTGDLLFELGATTNAIDSDTDTDGLLDSWEIHYGTYSAMMTDTDGDGLHDMAEHLAGSDPNNAASAFVVAQVDYQGSSAIVQWTAGAGRSYVVEYADASLDQAPTFSIVSEIVTATGATAQATVQDVAQDNDGYFRVRVVDGIF